MTSTQIRKLALFQMVIADIFCWVALIGAVTLAYFGERWLALLWLAIAVLNIAAYCANLKLYRRFEPK